MDDLCLKEIYELVKKQIINLEINRNSFNSNILPLAYTGAHIRWYNRQKRNQTFFVDPPKVCAAVLHIAGIAVPQCGPLVKALPANGFFLYIHSSIVSFVLVFDLLILKMPKSINAGVKDRAAFMHPSIIYHPFIYQFSLHKVVFTM